MINTGPSMLSKKDIERMKKMKMKMAVSNAVNRIMREEEAKIDRTMDKISKMDEDDLEELRAKRLEDLKRKQMQRSKWFVLSFLAHFFLFKFFRFFHIENEPIFFFIEI